MSVAKADLSRWRPNNTRRSGQETPFDGARIRACKAGQVVELFRSWAWSREDLPRIDGEGGAAISTHPQCSHVAWDGSLTVTLRVWNGK